MSERGRRIPAGNSRAARSPRRRRSPRDPRPDDGAGRPEWRDSEFLEARAISKSFGATRALREASLTVRAGEIRVLLGENGIGKSTLGKIVAGLIRPDADEIRIGGWASPCRSCR